MLTGVAFFVLRGVADAKIEGFVKKQIDAALQEKKDLSDYLKKQIGNVFKDYVKRIAKDKGWIKAVMKLFDRKNEVMNLLGMKNEYEGMANALCYIIAMKYYDNFDWENTELDDKVDRESGKVILCEIATRKIFQKDLRFIKDISEIVESEIDNHPDLKPFDAIRTKLKNFVPIRSKAKNGSVVKVLSEFLCLVDHLKKNQIKAMVRISMGSGKIGNALKFPERDDIYDFSKYPEGFDD